MNYYEDIIAQIKQAIIDKKYENANVLINEELSMPYIPLEIEDQLHELKAQVKLCNNTQEFTPLTKQQLESALLNCGYDQQAQAVESLNVSNARLYIHLIQQALLSDSVDQEVKVGLVHVLKDQVIDGIYEFKLNGNLLSFNLNEVVDYLQDNQVMTSFDRYIDSIVDDNPSFNQLVKQMVFDCLIHLFPIQVVGVSDYALVLNQVFLTAIKAANVENNTYLNRLNQLIESINRKNV